MINWPPELQSLLLQCPVGPDAENQQGHHGHLDWSWLLHQQIRAQKEMKNMTIGSYPTLKMIWILQIITQVFLKTQQQHVSTSLTHCHGWFRRIWAQKGREHGEGRHLAANNVTASLVGWLDKIWYKAVWRKHTISGNNRSKLNIFGRSFFPHKDTKL